MSKKVELTICFPQLCVEDSDGRHWWPFDETERFYLNQPGFQCEVCQHTTFKGFKRGVTHKPASMSYLCVGCVALITPWEASS